MLKTSLGSTQVDLPDGPNMIQTHPAGDGRPGYQLIAAAVSSAMFKPVHADTKAAKDECPRPVCKMKRPNKWTWWVQCSEEKGCGQ